MKVQSIYLYSRIAAAVVQSVRAFVSAATGSVSSTAKQSATGVSVTGYRRWSCQTHVPWHSTFGTLKNPNCSLAMHAEHRSKSEALFHLHDKVSSGTWNSNKQNNIKVMLINTRPGRKTPNKQTKQYWSNVNKYSTGTKNSEQTNKTILK